MRVATDIGGTFTDLVYVDDEGHIRVDKSHTTPPNFEEGVMNVLQKSGIDNESITGFIHGTTIIINALTERKGAKTGLITTNGFRDVLEIARGNRPDLFNIRYKKPTPFIERYLRQEVDERMNYKGEVLKELNSHDIEEIVAYFKKENVEAIAIAYLHAYVNPKHEIETAQRIKELWPEVDVSTSHEVIKEWREYERTNTTALNAYVKPAATKYIDKLDDKLRGAYTGNSQFIMQSNGGMTTFGEAKNTPINMVESGPVAGIYGSAVLGEIIGEENIIALDIGGTTAKCSLIENGEVKVSTDYYIEKTERSAGYPIKVPSIDIVEIGNGGGSIARIDEAGTLKVGPESAGASPGPVAYGQGGEKPTTTDANVLTGRLSTRHFDYSSDIHKIRETMENKIANQFNMSAEEASLGIIRIANSNMLNALKLVSVRKGYNPKEFSLVAFGGGGSMHAAALAKELGIKKVIVPVASPVFSAWGMLMSELRHDYIQTYIMKMSEITVGDVQSQWKLIEDTAFNQFEKEGVEKERIHFKRFMDMRYVGQEHTVKVPVRDGVWTSETFTEINEAFHRLHEKNYTFKLPESDIEIVNLHLTALGEVEKPKIKQTTRDTTLEDAKIETREVYFESPNRWVTTDVYNRDLLPTNQIVEGPVLVEEKSAVTVIYEGQNVKVDSYGNLIIETLEAN
ncbi:MAG TPA: hydantoinase/oxoprolinase family protein [Virgibacillus sp.]|nr:hydantoinase/oxoprolinase family protein [Virgibacillus sp.]